MKHPLGKKLRCSEFMSKSSGKNLRHCPFTNDSLLLDCPQHLLDKLQKFRMQQQGLCVKLRNLTTYILFLKLSNTSHSIQNFTELSASIPSMAGNSRSVFVRVLQPYTPARQLRSASDTRTFVTLRVNTKTFGDRFFFLCWPICLEQVASNTPPL